MTWSTSLIQKCPIFLLLSKINERNNPSSQMKYQCTAEQKCPSHWTAVEEFVWFWSCGADGTSLPVRRTGQHKSKWIVKRALHSGVRLGYTWICTFSMTHLFISITVNLRFVKSCCIAILYCQWLVKAQVINLQREVWLRTEHSGSWLLASSPSYLHLH